ncbi:MAG: hypothetical protein SFY32_09750 [Bacteroidota bacterium]|nr:hypothetical protein [Bacteroidota bacterium]
MKSFEFTAIKIFEKYNFSREDAEALVETIKEAKSDETATKTDIQLIIADMHRMESSAKSDIIKLEKEIANINKEIADIKKDIRLLDVKIESVKNQIILWVFSIMFGMAGLIIGVLKFT